MPIQFKAMFMTTIEIGHLTQTAHKFVLKRACNKLIEAGLTPNDYWGEDELGVKKCLHLPKRECFLTICDAWYSSRAIAEVLAVWDVWELNDAGVAL